MTYKTRVANPKKKSSKKKTTKKKKVQLDSDVRAALRDFLGDKEFTALRPTGNKVTKVPADMRSALSTPATRLKAAYTRAKRKKKGEPLTDLERKALAKYGGKEKTAKTKTAKKEVTKVPADMRSALGKPRSSKGKEAVFGKSSKKKTAKKKTAARAPSVKELRAQLKELQKTCGVLLKRLGKSTEPADRRRMKADIRKAITSNSACRLAAQRWGSPSPSCNRRHPLPKGYRGPKGAKQLGEYSTKTKWRGAPSLNNTKFWGS